MSDKEVSTVNSKIKKSGAKSRSSVALYAVIPVLFAALILTISAPVFIKADKLAAEYIALMQDKFSAANDELFVSDGDYIPSDIDDGIIKLEKSFGKGERIGTIVCESSGINTPVYYGIGIGVLGAGAGLNSDYSLFGGSGVALVEGFNSDAFKQLENISAGDIIEVTTSYGIFKYKVSDESFESADADLVLCTNKLKDSFSYEKDEKLYICADKISGPVLEEEEVSVNEQ